jgi:hypothetical protein
MRGGRIRACYPVAVISRVSFGGDASTVQVDSVVSEDTLPLEEAAARYDVPLVRLRRWCATGKLRCERDGDDWLVPVSEGTRITELSTQYRTGSSPVRALAVPVTLVPSDLATTVADRLGLTATAVTLTPLALDGVEYVVAVWRGDILRYGGLPALQELAVELDAELLDGEIRSE